MDPWLEHPDLWPDVYNSLITSIRDELAPLLAPRYFVGVGTRTTVLSGLDIEQIYQPDVAIHAATRIAKPSSQPVAVLERPAVPPEYVVVTVAEEIEETYLVIEELPGRKLVTVVEVLSPTNKKTTEGRRDYVKKRDDVIRSRVNLVEIDLMRGGTPMPMKTPASPGDYRILICRAGSGQRAHLYVFSWTKPIPTIPIPLVAGDAEPILDLNRVLHALVERARYDLVIDYQQPPDPPLRPEDRSIATEIFANATNAPPESPSQEGVIQ
jgi:hypothetical protein